MQHDGLIAGLSLLGALVLLGPLLLPTMVCYSLLAVLSPRYAGTADLRLLTCFLLNLYRHANPARFVGLRRGCLLIAETHSSRCHWSLGVGKDDIRLKKCGLNRRIVVGLGIQSAEGSSLVGSWFADLEVD